MESMIRDISLAESGQKKIDWVKGHMPLLNYFNEKYAPTQLFKGINMVVTIHLEAKSKASTWWSRFIWKPRLPIWR